MPSIFHRFLNAAIAEDEAANALLGGSPKRTISGTVGRAAAKGATWAVVAQVVINWLMDSSTHCQDAAAIERNLP